MEFLDKIKDALRPTMDSVRRAILGPNNERIDFIMDSFYKLSSKQQIGALIALGIGVLVIIGGVFVIYLSRINALETELDVGYKTIQNLRVLAVEFNNEKKRFDWLKNNVSKNTSTLRPKPFFERTSKNVGISLNQLRTQETPLPPDNLLSSDFTQLQVDFGIPKVSLPRLLKFLGEVEKSNHHLYVKNLEIKSRFEDKLYFDSQAKILGVKTK